MLVPAVGLVQVGTQVLADRFLYLPQIGLWIALAWHGGRLGRLAARAHCILAAAAVLVLALFTVAAWRQTAVWKNSESLWTHVRSATGRIPWPILAWDWTCMRDIATTWRKANFAMALCADPDSAMAYCGLGWLLEAKGNLDEAAQCYRRDRPQGDLSRG